MRAGRGFMLAPNGRVVTGGRSLKAGLRCLALLGLLGLSSCAYTRPIYFKNPANGLIVTCGPYTHRDVNAGKQDLCIQKAAQEGLIRVRN